MIAARNAWETPLEITFNDVTSRANANIRVYGGRQLAILDETGYWEDASGFADIHAVRVPVATIYPDGSPRTVYRFTGTDENANFIVVYAEVSRFVTMTAIHELGHALGYWGHSPNRGEVMYGTRPWLIPNNTLTPAEINHLRQIYFNFRN